MNFYILDDDISTRKILQRIIREDVLGDCIGESEDPIVAEQDILVLQPDIILIDLLMPLQNGIETVQHLKEKHVTSKFIMISQIENKELVAEAYQNGIEFFIHKPLNTIEVSTVIHHVLEKIKMEQSLLKIQESLNLLPIVNDTKHHLKSSPPFIIQEILSELGIIGENGSTDMTDILTYLFYNDIDIRNISLKTLYREILNNQRHEINDKSVKALEQRLRRAINQALTNLASLGLTDYSHPKFEHYATKFFDFHEVRLKMNEIDEKKTPRTSRVNIRKFLHAFYIEIKSRL